MSVHIKEILTEFIKKKGKGNETQGRIEEVLRKVLGENLLGHISIQGIYKKKLVFNLRNSAVQYEVGLKKKELHTALKEKFPNLEEIQLRIK